SSVSEAWRETFFHQEQSEEGSPVYNPKRVEAELTQRARRTSSVRAGSAGTPISGSADETWMAKQAAVLRLIQAYRILGHVKADTDPIHLRQIPDVNDLEPAAYGLTDVDMDLVFN